MIDCEGSPVGAAVDTCTGETVRDWRMVARCVPGRDALDETGARARWTTEAARDLLTRTLEAEADALSFPPAGSVWRSPSTGRDGTVEYAPNGRRWRLLFDDGPGEWCYDGIAEGWEQVFERPPEGSVWRNAREGLTGRVEYGKAPDRWRLVYENIPVGVPRPPASHWRGGMLSADWERRDTEAAPQAVTLEVGTINASDPGGYRSPADAHLPAIEVPRG